MHFTDDLGCIFTPTPLHFTIR